MAIKNTKISPLLKEGTNITLTQNGQVITIAATDTTNAPGGTSGQVQFNDSGAFGGDAGLTYNKTTNVLGVESIDFATTPTAADAERRLHWDNDEGSLVLTLKGGNLTIPIGQEVATLVYNAEATTLTKGTVVYVFGASGQRISVKKAVNTSDATSAQTLGVVAESIASGAEGFVMVQGMVRGIDTSAYAQGDTLYLSATAGLFTKTKPVAPNHLVYVGFVVKVNASSGEIFVRPQNGYEMDEIHDYLEGSVQNNDVISYESSTSLYKPKSIPTLLGYTPLNPTRNLTINGTTYDLSADRTWSVGTVTSVGGTGTVNGITLTGSITSSGNLTLGGTLSGVSLTSQVSGTLPIANGGTGLTALGTAGQLLRVNSGVTALEYFTPTYISGNQTITLSGDVSGSGTTAVTTTIGAGKVTNTMLVNSSITIQGTSTSLGGSVDVINGTGFVKANGTTITYDNSTYYLDSNPNGYTSNTGTVTSVAALTLGTSGTDLSSSVANGTTTPVITLNVPTASATNRGALSSADWSTFNGKQAQLNGTGFVVASGTTITYDSSTYYLASNPNGYTTNTGTVTSIATSSPITGGTITTSGTIGITQSSGSADGYLSSTDWTTFNNKFTLPSFTSGSVLFSNGTTIAQDNANFFWDDSNNRLGIGTAVPGGKLEVTGDRTYLRGTTEDYTLGIGRGGYTGNFFLGATASNAPDLLFSNNAGTRIMTVTNGGNLGLGTASPAAIISGTETTLNVKGSVANAVGSIVARSFGTTNTTSIGIAAYDTLNVTAVYTESNSPMAFYTNATERMRIFSTGNVFIGSSPSDAGYKLDVNGTGRFSGALTAGSDVNLESNESYINLFSSYVVGLNARARIRAVGAGGGSGYGGDFRVSTRATNNIWNDDVFVLNSSGAATFSSSVTANGFYANAGNSARFYRGANDYYWRIHSDSSNYLTFGAYLANGTDYLTNPKIVLQDDGKVKFNAYTSSSSFTGTAAGYLAFDSSGNILTTGNPASGSVTGSGTTDYIPKWTSSSALGNSGITDNGTNVTLNSRSLVVNTSGQSATISTFYQSGKTGNNIWIGGGGTSSGGSFTDAGSNNTSLGVNALYSITDGQANIGIGYRALYTTTTGTNNVSIGNASLESNTTGYFNCSIGTSSLFHNTTGYQNVAIGLQSGYLTNSGGSNQTSYDSVYIGYDSRASANGNSNEIVIGAAGRGNGSNTATIGDTNTTTYTSKINVTGGQITFPATQNASSDANTLDDYEEGTWTPALANTGASITYATNGQVGAYTKIGRQVTITFRIQTSTSTFNGNSLTITGIPASLTSQNTTNLEYVTSVAWSGSVTNFVNLQARIGASTTTITLWKTTAAGTSSQTTMVGSDIGNATTLQGTITYFT